MNDEPSPAMGLIHRWLNDKIGIKLHGGPWDGQIKIMQLDQAGLPSPRFQRQRTRGVWHIYQLAVTPPG